MLTVICLIILLVILFMCWIKNDEGYYFTQAYYPHYYASGYGTTDPITAYGYKGPGSYRYPGYGAAFNYEKNASCRLGCVNRFEYGTRDGGNSDALKNCLESCVTPPNQ